jgi:hypothetical protein
MVLLRARARHDPVVTIVAIQNVGPALMLAVFHHREAAGLGPGVSAGEHEVPGDPERPDEDEERSMVLLRARARHDPVVTIVAIQNVGPALMLAVPAGLGPGVSAGEHEVPGDPERPDEDEERPVPRRHRPPAQGR